MEARVPKTTDRPTATKKASRAQAAAPKEVQPPRFSRSRNNWDTVPGYPLIRALRARLLEIGENSDEVILEKLGLVRSTWNQMLNGSRNVATLTNDARKLKWLADFLGMPPLAVRVLANDVQVEELKVQLSIDDRLRLVAQQLSGDPIWAMYAPQNLAKEWDTLPLKTRMLIAELYEQNKRKVLDWTAQAVVEALQSGQGEPDPVEQA